MPTDDLMGHLRDAPTHVIPSDLRAAATVIAALAARIEPGQSPQLALSREEYRAYIAALKACGAHEKPVGAAPPPDPSAP